MSLWDMAMYMSFVPVYACAPAEGCYIHIRRGLPCCSFNCTGQCESLYAWDE